MLCNQDGIGLNRAELDALLTFAAKPSDEERSHLAVVQFIVEGDRCWAYSTDGHRALQGDGESDASHSDGQWLVIRAFLDQALRNLTNDKQNVRLQFSGASLTQARVEDELGLEVWNLGSPRDAVPEQGRFPAVRDLMRIKKVKAGATCIAIATKYLKDLTKVSAAAGRGGVDQYVPEDPLSLVYFKCQGDPTTSWLAAIAPMRSSQVDSHDDDDNEEGAETEPLPFGDDAATAAEDADVVLTGAKAKEFLKELEGEATVAGKPKPKAKSSKGKKARKPAEAPAE